MEKKTTYYFDGKEVELGKPYDYKVVTDKKTSVYKGTSLPVWVAEEMVIEGIFTKKEELVGEIEYNDILKHFVNKFCSRDAEHSIYVLNYVGVANPFYCLNILLKEASELLQEMSPIETKKDMSVYVIRSSNGTVEPTTVKDETFFKNAPWFKTKEDAEMVKKVLANQFKIVFDAK